MTRNQIIQWAREAGAFPELSTTPEKDVAFLMRFAALVVAAENEARAEVCAARGREYDRGYAEGATAENEACAKVCEEMSAMIASEKANFALEDCARNIRQRRKA